MHIYSCIRLIGISALSCVALTQSAGAEVVGTMTAVKTQIAGNNGNILSVGAKISLGDQLSSNKTGLGMIVFNDESSAKISPNSKLIIDEFVYQPGRSKGKVAININSGIVRFYGGQISKSGKMQITTPHIVLGVRGGIMDTRVSELSTMSILRAGRMSCSVNGQTRTITKPGFACVSDGKSLKIELSKDDDMDSQDTVADNGVSGQKGNGIKTASACTEGSNDASQLCKSANGALPGLTGITGRRTNPLLPPSLALFDSKKHEKKIVESPSPTVTAHPQVVVAPTITQTAPPQVVVSPSPPMTGPICTNPLGCL